MNIKQLYDKLKSKQSYVNWLESQLETSLKNKSSILNWVKTMFQHAEQKEWFETYWAIDIHGTFSIPDYRATKKTINYYPFAKEVLQILSKRKDIILILFTSSYPKELEVYKKQLELDGIIFNYVNENPEISSSKGSFGFYKQKFYFNVLFDDKAGFNPEVDWVHLFTFLTTTNYRPNPNWEMKYKESYHKK